MPRDASSGASVGRPTYLEIREKELGGTGESCPDCLLRDNFDIDPLPGMVVAHGSTLDAAGIPRHHPWYGHRLSRGCHSCKGSGRVASERAW